jgi:RNA polymerase sigma factor (sigma-70 family)
MSLHDPAGLPVLSADHVTLARRLSRRYHCPGLDADDLTQEAVLAVLAALPLYEPRHGEASAYLAVSISRRLNRLIERDLNRAERESELADVHSDPSPSPQDVAIAHEAHERITLLPEQQARVLELGAMGYPVAEIVAETGLSTAAVWQARSRGIAEVRPGFLD